MNGRNLSCSIKEINLLRPFSFCLVRFPQKKSLFCFFCKENELFLKKILLFSIFKKFYGVANG